MRRYFVIIICCLLPLAQMQAEDTAYCTASTRDCRDARFERPIRHEQDPISPPQPRVPTGDSKQDKELYRTDTVRFEATQLIAPAALITVGALGVSCRPFKQARLGINDAIGVHKCAPVDDILQYAPMAAYLGVEYLGAPCRKPIVDRVIVGATSAIIMTALTRSIKPLVNETRPNGGSHSFPSGHTATAFMGAELLRQDYGPAAGAIGYATASLVGAMRILNNRHWANDVLAGAGIGILSAYAGEWLLPFNRRWLGLDCHRTLVVIPTYSPAAREACLNLALTI